MAAWKYACKTIQGMNLDLKLLGRSNVSLKLIKAMSGSGSVSPTQLITLKDIISPKQNLNLLDAVERLDRNTVKIPVILKNKRLAEKYDMHQMGIYAEDPDLGEILYIVLQSDEAEPIPSSTEIKDFTLEWYLNISLNNADNVEVLIDETCNLTTEQADARYVQKNGNASNTTVTFDEADERKNIESGEKLSTLFGKVKKFLSGLKAVAFSGSYKDLADKPTASDVGALALDGTAVAAKKLSTAYTIDGVSFNGSAAIIHYGSCSTAAATAAKTVACTGFTLVTGATIRVKFTVTNTAANPTLNVNGTGTKAIYYRGTAIAAGYLAANRTYEFVYNGTQYELVGDIDTNTTYSNMTGASTTAAGKAGLVPVPAAGAATRYLRSDGTWQVPPDTNTTYSNMTGASTTAAGKAGLAPAPTAGTATRYLRSDGTWTVPPNTTYGKASVSTLGLVYLVNDMDSSSTEAAATANVAKTLYQNSIYKSISRIGTTSLSVSSIMSSKELIIVLNCSDGNSNECEFTWTLITDWIPTVGKHLLSGYKTGNFEGLAEVAINRSSANIVNCIVGGTQYKTTATLRIHYRG